MKITQFLFHKIIAPLIVAFLTPMAISIGSKINTGNWINWFGLIPKIAKIVFVGFIFLWAIIIVVFNRLKQLQGFKNVGRAFVITTPLFGWTTVGKLNYAGVLWRIHAPAPSPLESFDPSSISQSSIEVETPPRCPKCETELEQSHNFWGGYIWRCVSCGFQRRNKDSYYQEAERAEKIARREWEKQKLKGPNT